MARILAYTSPARGHLFPLTPVLLELRSRGHAIALRTLADEVPRMRELGFEAAPIDPAIEAIEPTDWQAPGQRAALQSTTGMFAARGVHEVPDLRAAIAAERPDALIVDINTWGAMALAEAGDLPWAAFCPYPLPLSSKDAPPYGLGLRPMGGPLGRIRDAVVRALVLRVVERTYAPPVNAVRESAGLGPIRTTDQLFGAPPTILSFTAEGFEYPRRDWPASVVMVGPGRWDPPAPAPAWLAAIDRPIVLVTTSSEFQDDGRLVATAFEALRDEPVFVVGTLPSGDPARFSVPPNARLERFIAHSAVLPRAMAAITHGGMGATQKALAHGVPVVAIPFGRDQFEVGRRVEVAGAGTMLPASRLTAERLRAAVALAGSRADGARRVAAAYDAAGGPPAAADAVESRLLRIGPPTSAAPAPAPGPRRA